MTQETRLARIEQQVPHRKQGGPRLVWAPLPGPQTAAYESEADELLYGGAAGGAKTDLLIGLALTRHRKSIIFRREYPQLKDVVQRTRDLLSETGAQFNGNDLMWRGIPGRRSLEFGAVQYEDDRLKYKGRPHDLKAFDELSEFTESQYLFLTGWARTTIPGQRVRIVGATNPPTHSDGAWVIRRWAAWLDPQHSYPAEPGELRWYMRIDGKEVEREDGTPFVWKGETLLPRTRTFIPARLADNPYLLNTGYGQTLQSLPEPLRSQLLYGDFSAGIEDDVRQVIPTAWVLLAQARWQAEAQPPRVIPVIACDVARGGADRTVIAKRYGNWFSPLVKMPGQATPNGPAVATLVQKEMALGSTAYIDVIGVGASAYDTLKSQRVKVVPVNVAESSAATDRSGQLHFRNRRAELYWKLREALDPELGDDLALPDDPELRAELCASRWELTISGIKIEDKDEIRKRLGRSPDCADAVVMALQIPAVTRVSYETVTPGRMATLFPGRNAY